MQLEVLDNLFLDETSGKISVVKAMSWSTGVVIMSVCCFIVCLARGNCLFCIPTCLKTWYEMSVK